jgi:hypothetical protein
MICHVLDYNQNLGLAKVVPASMFNEETGRYPNDEVRIARSKEPLLNNRSYHFVPKQGEHENYYYEVELDYNNIKPLSRVNK